jgi:hypothetical protein
VTGTLERFKDVLKAKNRGAMVRAVRRAEKVVDGLLTTIAGKERDVFELTRERDALKNRLAAAASDVRHHFDRAAELERKLSNGGDPIPMLLFCPACGDRHVDEGEFAAKSHHTHACQTCGMAWRPAVVPTVGVRFLPGFKNGERK